MPELSGIFRRPFREQVAAWRLRLDELRPTSSSRDPGYADFDRAFMVAGATKADLLADLAAAVDRAIADGTGFEVFKRDFRAIVAKHGWHGWTGEGSERGEAWRMRTIYRTNMRTTYMAGRHAQLVDGKYKWWVYRHSGAAHPRLDHLSWDGLALPPDHPFWQTHYPPNGWGCGCVVEGARTERGIRRKGGDPNRKLPDNWNTRDPKTGAPPGIGKGWARAPDRETDDLILSLKDKLPKLPAEIGAAFAAMWPQSARKRLAEAFSDFLHLALTTRPEGRAMVVGALRSKWIEAVRARGVVVETAEIVVTDRNILHTFRGTDHVRVPSSRKNSGGRAKIAPLDLDWYRSLPLHLATPKAVLLDDTGKKPTVLLVFDHPDRKLRLVLELNVPVKKLNGVFNTVVSGRVVSPDDIRADIGRGIELLEGKV